jgi:hypothetical protein
MPRPRYQFADADVPVMHRWVQAKVRDITRAAWDQFPHEHSTATSLQKWALNQHLNHEPQTGRKRLKRKLLQRQNLFE